MYAEEVIMACFLKYCHNFCDWTEENSEGPQYIWPLDQDLNLGFFKSIQS